MIRAVLLSGWFAFSLGLHAQSLIQVASQIADQRENPYRNEKAAEQAGAKLFNQNCQHCHGKAGTGNGRRHTPPLATPPVRAANPGTLFWILTNGSPSNRMPSFNHLPAQQRWQIITYLEGLGH